MMLLAGCSSWSDSKPEPEAENEVQTYYCYAEAGEDSNPYFVQTKIEAIDTDVTDEKTGILLDIGNNAKMDGVYNGDIEGVLYKPLETKHSEIPDKDPKEIDDYIKGYIHGYELKQWACFPAVKIKEEEKATPEYYINRLHERYNAYIETTKTPDTPDEETPTTSDGIRPEFQQSMDEYLEFFRQYADFMQRYSEADDPVSMLNEYSTLMSQYADMIYSFEAVEDEDISNEELKLYIQTNAEIQKLILSAYWYL